MNDDRKKNAGIGRAASAYEKKRRNQHWALVVPFGVCSVSKRLNSDIPYFMLSSKWAICHLLALFLSMHNQMCDKHVFRLTGERPRPRTFINAWHYYSYIGGLIFAWTGKQLAATKHVTLVVLLLVDTIFSFAAAYSVNYECFSRVRFLCFGN